MRWLIRSFFRLVRLILTPFVLLSEWLATRSRPPKRDAEEQQLLDEQCQQLALYQFKTCPFCIKVRVAMHRRGLSIKRLDAQHDLSAQEQLLAGGGKLQVPCLRVGEGDDAQWIYESDAVIGYLDDLIAAP